MTLEATDRAGAGGGLGQRTRSRHKYYHRTTKTTKNNDGEDILSPLIATPVPRISDHAFSTSNASNGSMHPPPSPYSNSSLPHPQRKTGSLSHRDDDQQEEDHPYNNHQFRTHDQHEEMIHDGIVDEDDDDSKSKASFLSKASKKIKNKLSGGKKERKPRREGEEGGTRHEYHNENGDNDIDVGEPGCDDGEVIDVEGKIKGRKKEEHGSSSARTREGRDPSPTHDDGDDEEYYGKFHYCHDNGHRQNRWQRHRDRKDGNDDDGECIHNDGFTPSTNATPTRSRPLQKRAQLHLASPQEEEKDEVDERREECCDDENESEIQSVWLRTDDEEEQHIYQQQHHHHLLKSRLPPPQQQPQQPTERHSHRRDHPPMSLLYVKDGRRPQSPEGIVAQEKEATVQQSSPIHSRQKCKIPQEVVTITTSKAIGSTVQDSLVIARDIEITRGVVQKVVVTKKAHEHETIRQNRRGKNENDNYDPTSFAEKEKYAIKPGTYPKRKQQKQHQLRSAAKEGPSGIVDEEDSPPLAEKKQIIINSFNRSPQPTKEKQQHSTPIAAKEIHPDVFEEKESPEKCTSSSLDEKTSCN